MFASRLVSLTANLPTPWYQQTCPPPFVFSYSRSLQVTHVCWRHTSLTPIKSTFYSLGEPTLARWVTSPWGESVAFARRLDNRRYSLLDSNTLSECERTVPHTHVHTHTQIYLHTQAHLTHKHARARARAPVHTHTHTHTNVIYRHPVHEVVMTKYY